MIERRHLQSVHRKVKDQEPLVLYFHTKKGRTDFVNLIQEAKPGMISKAVEL